MKKSVMLKWVKALRSGKYKQGKHKLQTRDTYCCLGVLCKIAPTELIVLNPIGSEGEQELRGNTLLRQYSVQDWAQLKSGSGFVQLKTTAIELAALNDKGKSFKYIANLIEKHWKAL